MDALAKKTSLLFEAQLIAFAGNKKSGSGFGKNKNTKKNLMQGEVNKSNAATFRAVGKYTDCN